MFILITALLHFAPLPAVEYDAAEEARREYEALRSDCTASTRIVANPDGTTTIITRTVCVREGK